MKRIVLIGFLLIGTVNAQTILNGGLEPEGWMECTMYSPPPLPDSVFEELALQCGFEVFDYMIHDCFPYITKFNVGEAPLAGIDILHTDCIVPIEVNPSNPEEAVYDTLGVPASQGTFYFDVCVNEGDYNEHLALELSEPLTQGEWYKLSYDIQSLTFLTEMLDTSLALYDSIYLELGLSFDANALGINIHLSDLPTPEWVTQTVIFQATDTFRYVTTKTIQAGLASNCMVIDNFVLSTDTATSIVEPMPLKPRRLLRIIDVLGRETQPKPNTPLFYLYDDGTVEKRIIIE